MTIPRLNIAHIATDFEISSTDCSSWDSVEPRVVNRYWNGDKADEHRSFDVSVLWSEIALYIRFDARQNEPLVVNERPQTSVKTMRLWERDVCELFIAPDTRNRRRYFEFEIAPTGEWLDLIVDWMKDEPRDWEYTSGMEPFARIEKDKVTVAMKIPWTAFGKKPEAGDVWLGNLFRQVGSGETRGYLAWSPTMTATPQFHVPEKFGEFVFAK